jgi:vacuolar protein sorting-associated protein 13A/C
MLYYTSSLFFQEAGRHRICGDDPTFSALDEDDFQTVILENKLGCDIYLKKVEHSDAVDQLHHGDYTSVWIPPPRFSDRLNVADESREERYYVAIQILEAKVVTVAKLIKYSSKHLFIIFTTTSWKEQ